MPANIHRPLKDGSFYVVTLSVGPSVRLSVNFSCMLHISFIDWRLFISSPGLLFRKYWASQSQISYGASMGRGNEKYSLHLGHMTKMTAMPVYGKNPLKIFSEEK